GRFDEAIVLFRSFIDSIAVDVPGENARKPAALYWMGECLYSLGQLDRAQDIFSLIVEQYPQSVKYEASSYRLALINQKKIEVELLAILKWSHEESLKTVEEYQRRERSYDQAIIAYQRRIADLLRDDGTSRLEEVNAEYRRRLAEAEEQIALLERLLDETRSLPAPAEPPAEESTGLPPEVRPPTPAPLYSPMYPGGVSLDAGPAAAVPPAAISPAAPPEAATQAAQAPAAPPAPPPAPRQSPDQTERLRSIRASAVDLITGLDGELTGSGAAGEGY
ncbi:MAG: tetratricopeptide repeat protein, partial [Spirochaetaceae bacterium]|nr:tetratricopeptide repeat protein [Spirochaetaceae bacterium]